MLFNLVKRDWSSKFGATRLQCHLHCHAEGGIKRRFIINDHQNSKVKHPLFEFLGTTGTGTDLNNMGFELSGTEYLNQFGGGQSELIMVVPELEPT